jgi:hypothetical protein
MIEKIALVMLQNGWFGTGTDLCAAIGLEYISKAAFIINNQRLLL